MNDLHSNLVLYRAQKSDAQSAVRALLQESKFKIYHEIDGTILAAYPGQGFGFTDRQTASRLSIVFKEADGVTALLFVHRTRLIGNFTEIMFGAILKDEVDQILSRLSEQFERLAALDQPEKLEHNGDHAYSEGESRERPANQSREAQPPSTVAAADVEWYYRRQREQHGPFSESVIRSVIAQGHVREGDLVWKEGFPDWRPAIEVFPFSAAEPAAAQSHPFQQSVPDPRFQDRLNVEIICEPHRGGTILTLALFGLCLCLPAALTACLWGSEDLKRMRAGTMDTSGRRITKWGTVLGIIGLVPCILALAGILLIVLRTLFGI